MSDTLLMLPGLLCDEALWAPQTIALGDRIAPLIPRLTEEDSLAAMADRVLAMAPPTFALAGLSMGGYLALEIALRAPERVERLALLDTSARADDPDQLERRKALIQLAQRGKFKGVTPRLMPLLISARRLADTTLTGSVMAMAERVGQAAFVRQQKAIMTRPDRRASLDRITCPTLVLCGLDDALTPPDLSRETAAGIPGAELVLLEDCGHLATLEQPEQVTAALERWLGF